MKKLITLLFLAASAFTGFSAVDQYVFSKDGVDVGSAPRALPVQAVQLNTGKVIVGLHARDDATIASCGWYKLLPGVKPETFSNEYAVVSGYAFTATTCQPTYTIKWRKPTPRTFSKLALITTLKQYGKWDQVKAFITQAGYEDEWVAAQDLSEEYPLFTTAIDAMINAGIATREEVDAILKAAHDGSNTRSARAARMRR